MKNVSEMPAIVLNFLLSESDWQINQRGLRDMIHREIKERENVTEINYRYGQMQSALRGATTLHASFAPKPVSKKKLFMLARYKIESLGLPPDYWDKAFFVIIPPWEPDLEKALLWAVEKKMGKTNTLPVAVAIPEYILAAGNGQNIFSIAGFQLRRNIYITVNGKLRIKPLYTRSSSVSQIESA